MQSFWNMCICFNSTFPVFPSPMTASEESGLVSRDCHSIVISMPGKEEEESVLISIQAAQGEEA